MGKILRERLDAQYPLVFKKSLVPILMHGFFGNSKLLI